MAFILPSQIGIAFAIVSGEPQVGNRSVGCRALLSRLAPVIFIGGDLRKVLLQRPASRMRCEKLLDLGRDALGMPERNRILFGDVMNIGKVPRLIHAFAEWGPQREEKSRAEEENPARKQVMAAAWLKLAFLIHRILGE